MSACTITPVHGPAGPLLGMVDATLRGADVTRNVMSHVSPAQVTVGGPLNLTVRSSTAGFLYVFQIGTDGKSLSLVFPNALDGTNYMAAGSNLSLPRPGWRLAARGPAGQGYLISVVAERQQNLRALDAAVAQQRIAIEGPYGATMVAFKEVTP
jgi:hypothetical protein